MARLVGTGQDPNGQYGEGVLFDVPRDDPHYAELVSNGWAEPVDPHNDPARGTVDIANSVVRGDVLAHPAEQDIAEHIGDRAQAIVEKQDPDAVHTSDEEGAARGRALAAAAVSPDERPWDGDSGAAKTSDWEDGPSTGDVATHTTLDAKAGEPEGTPQGAVPEPLQVEQQPQGGDSTLTAESGYDDIKAEYDRRTALEEGDAERIDELETSSGSGKGGAFTKADYAKAIGIEIAQ